MNSGTFEVDPITFQLFKSGTKIPKIPKELILSGWFSASQPLFILDCRHRIFHAGCESQSAADESDKLIQSPSLF